MEEQGNIMARSATSLLKARTQEPCMVVHTGKGGHPEGLPGAKEIVVEPLQLGALLAGESKYHKSSLCTSSSTETSKGSCR